jgi:DNA-binding NarL/FixJ family response regulator
MSAAKRNFNTSIDTISLWIVEDDEFFRTTICSLLSETSGFECKGSFSSVEEALGALKDEYAPEVVLMDIGLPGMSGIEGVKRIKAISPATDIIILTIKEGDQEVFDAICAGANGYLLKNSTPEEIIDAVKEVVGGGAPMNAQIARKVLTMFTKFSVPEADYGLTTREKEILKLLIDGLTKKQIADRLFLAYYTIDTHMKNIYEKMQVHSRSEAVAKALKERLL